MRFWYLSCCQATKAQASQRKCPDSLEPLLLGVDASYCNLAFRQNMSLLASCVCLLYHPRVFSSHLRIKYSSTCLSGHSKIDKTKTDGSLMHVKSIAECSPLEHSAILLTCIK